MSERSLSDGIADSVLVLERDGDGKFICHDVFSLASLKNTVPGFGDRLAFLMEESGLSLMEVVGRYLLRYIEEKTDNEVLTWVLLVEEVNPDFQDDLDRSLVEIYKNEYKWQFGVSQWPEHP